MYFTEKLCLEKEKKRQKLMIQMIQLSVVRVLLPNCWLVKYSKMHAEVVNEKYFI